MYAVGNEHYCWLCCERLDKADAILNLGQHQQDICNMFCKHYRCNLSEANVTCNLW